MHSGGYCPVRPTTKVESAVGAFFVCKPMKLADLENINIRTLPTEVIKVIYKACHVELSERRQLVKVAKHDKMTMTRCHSIKSKHRLSALQPLMSEDWSDLYSGGDMARKYYVYAHVSPFSGEIDIDGLLLRGVPFYVGKGCGNRAFDLKRNEGHGVELRKLAKAGATPEKIVQILYSDLTECEALCIEAKLIHFFGTKFEHKRNGLLVNLDKPKVRV